MKLIRANGKHDSGMTFSGVSYISDNPFLSRMRGPYVLGYLLCPFSLLHTNQPTPYVCLRLGRPHFKTYFTATGITVVTQMV